MTNEISGYEELGNAIVLQAFSDYCTCKRALQQGRRSWGKISNCERELEDCIDFFHSERYKLLTNYNEELNNISAILRRLDSYVEDYERFPNTEFNFRGGE